MFRQLVRAILPDRPVDCRILRGPFRGARIRLNPRHSLRKIFGLYEHELNGWIRAVLPRVDVLYDIGANDGYFTFGCSNWFRHHKAAAQIFGFEPNVTAFQSLTTSASRYHDSTVEIQLVNQFVGEITGEQTVVLDEFVSAPGSLHPTNNALVKIDVEGAEDRVLRGAKKLMHAGNYFVVEIHSADLIQSVTALFEEQCIPIQLVSQRPLPLLGRENRSVNNWWLVSRLDLSKAK